MTRIKNRDHQYRLYLLIVAPAMQWFESVKVRLFGLYETGSDKYHASHIGFN